MNVQFDNLYPNKQTTKTLRVLPYMCKQQKEEIQAIMNAADEIGQAATSVLAGSGMGYNQLIEARDRFKQILISASTHYRICVEEENE